MNVLRRLWTWFTRPLDPPGEHVVDCPKCGTMVVVPCDDWKDE